MKAVPAALLVVLLAWVMLICAATTASSEINGGPKPTAPPMEQLDLKDVSLLAKYSKLIATLRLQLEDTTQSLFGIPRLRRRSGPEYIYIKFISAKGNSIAIAINLKDIYVQGFTYKNGNAVVARCFRDNFGDKGKQCKLIFDEAKTVQNIGYEGNYPSLQGRAGVGTGDENRRKVDLGKENLGSLIDIISESQKISSIPQEEAKLLLIVIQIVSEAVRFKYIENQVIANFNKKTFTPNSKVVTLETAWDKLSTAIAGANPQTGSFREPVELSNAKGKPWFVTNAHDIKQDIALLTSARASELPKWPLMDDNVPVSAQ